MHWTEALNRGPRRIAVGDCKIEVLHWSYHARLPDNVPHRHAYFEACLVGDYGRGVFSNRGERHEIQSGDFFLARPGALHQIQNTARREMELFWVSFVVAPPGKISYASTPHAASPGRALFQALADSSLVVAHDEAARLRALWSALSTLAPHAGIAGGAWQIESVAGALLLAIAQLGAGQSAPPLPNAQARIPNAGASTLAPMAVRYIHDNLDRRLSVDEIAAHVHVSSRHLARLMQQFTGVSPAAYIEHARLERAKALLCEDVPLKSVAARVGYGDVQQFTRAFSRREKLAPGAWRKGKAKPATIRHEGDLV